MDKKQHTDEVDVFELFGYIGRGFNNLGNQILRFFNFLMRNVIVLSILLIIGLVAGYFMDKTTPELRKTETLVVSNFGTSKYLYKSIDEIESKLAHSEKGFLKEIGLTEKESQRISLEIEPVISVHEITEEEQAFLELMRANESLDEEEKQAIINRNSQLHKITLFHPENVNAEKVMKRIINHLRQNSHYTTVFNNGVENLQRRIKSNLFILAQIDTLFKNYSKNIGDISALGENLVYSNSLNLGELLEIRMELQRNTGVLITENVENTTFLKIIEIGPPTKLKDLHLSSKKILFFPILLIGLFFLIHIMIRLSKKAAKLKEQDR